MRWLHFQFWLKVLEIALSPRASSAITSAWVTKSVPSPPYSLGTASVRKPSFEPFSTMSQLKELCASGASSRSSEIGFISSCANLRAVICQERCSLLSGKSINAPLFRGEHRRAAPVLGQRFGDPQPVVGGAVAAVEADAGVVDVLLQRHVAHHAHRAEAFGRVLGRAIDRKSNRLNS